MIAEARDRNPLAQLLRAANETVLGRSLHFQSASGASLTLEVAGRRVLRLATVEGLSGADECLAAEALDDEHKDKLIKLMQALAVPGFELSVSSGDMVRGGKTVSVGLPVALLADLLLVDLNELDSNEPDVLVLSSAPTDKITSSESVLMLRSAAKGVADHEVGRLGRFAQGIGPVVLAWLIAGGEDDGKSDGPKEMVAHLQGFLQDEADALSRQLDLVSNVPGGPVCLVLGAALVEGHSVICARSGKGMMLGLIDGDGTQHLLRAWTEASR